MNRIFDTLRHVVISPELLGAITVWAVFFLYPSVDFPLRLLVDGSAFGLGAAALAIACLAFCYQEGFAILDPSGAGIVLLEWPGYFKLKSRVVAAMCWCVAAIAGALSATWLVASGDGAKMSAALLVSSVFTAVISVASIALARIRIREILQARP